MHSLYIYIYKILPAKLVKTFLRNRNTYNINKQKQPNETERISHIFILVHVVQQFIRDDQS